MICLFSCILFRDVAAFGRTFAAGFYKLKNGVSVYGRVSEGILDVYIIVSNLYIYEFATKFNKTNKSSCNTR
jgi:hypothetical protein